METYCVQIVNPKAVRLLQDLADMELITIRREIDTANVSDLSDIIDDEEAGAREAVMRGAPTLIELLRLRSTSSRTEWNCQSAPLSL